MGRGSVSDFQQLRRLATKLAKDRHHFLGLANKHLENCKVVTIGKCVVSAWDGYAVWKRGKYGIIVIGRRDSLAAAKTLAEVESGRDWV